MANVDLPPASIDPTPLLTALAVSAEDWEASPVPLQHGVRRLWVAFQQLQSEFQQMRDELQRLREQLGKNSQNSSKPPSEDSPQAPKPAPKERTGRAPGGQCGHANTNRPLVPVEQLAAPPIPCRPETCQHCGRALTEHDCLPDPERHQVIDLPQIIARVLEYLRYTASCPQCGHLTRADLPPGVPTGGYGKVITAIICLLTGVYHLSKRGVSALMADCFQVPISEASIQQQEQTMSAAMAAPWQEARDAVQAAERASLDETGWEQQRDPDPPAPATPTAEPPPPALADPAQPQAAAAPPTIAPPSTTPEPPKKAWLWVAVCPLAVLFVIRRSRGSQVVKEILGLFAGVLTSDRWHAYNWYDLRQLCWAHLLRDFTAIAERGGIAHRIGTAVLAHADIMFLLWFRVRDGTLTLPEFQQAMEPIMVAVEALLKEGADTAGGRTATTCRWLYAHKKALWTFVHTAGVDPTNNAAEQAIRTAVIWRKLCYGTQTSAGSRYVERVLTVAATCRLQQRPVLAYLTALAEAVYAGTPIPALLPKRPEVV